MRRVFIGLALMSLASCTSSDAGTGIPGCDGETSEKAGMIGLFDPANDLLILNYDSKPDVDDLQAVAAAGSILQDPAYASIDFVATHGAYGIQTGTFLPAAELFTLAFGENWLDAHADRDGTVAALAERMQTAIAGGGKVWVAEAGQSDVSAAAVRMLPEEMWRSVNIVQHSYWNESQTSEDAMNTVVYNTTYHRIQDGNYRNNGSPGFTTDEAVYWDALLADPDIGALWAEAKRLTELHNPVAEYVNPHAEAGGMDFSDTAEIAYILGFADMEGVGDFVERFAAGE